MTGNEVKVERLAWADPVLGGIAFPKGEMRIRAGYGSGLARRPGEPAGLVWALGDRGPNLKPDNAIERYGLAELAHLRDVDGAKIMPRPDLGPAIAQLGVREDRVELVRELRVRDSAGEPVSGLPPPPGPNLLSEPAFDLRGRPLPADPGGLDTEGIVALADGGFWVGDEFGPSLVRLDAGAGVVRRLVPEGVALDAPYPVEAALPAIAARRKLNRGFEALALSPDGRMLFLAFQSPLAHPDDEAHKRARHVRLWRLDASTARVDAQFLYRLDPPESFARDTAKGEFGRDDVKVSELLCLSPDLLLALERGSETTKVYRIRLEERFALAREHLDPETRPTVEELSGGEGAFPLPVLPKALLFSSDDAPKLGADIEGMALVSECELLLVSDNDFGVEGAETGFWRLRFPAPLSAE
jgi:hypothetical protein